VAAERTKNENQKHVQEKDGDAKTRPRPGFMTPSIHSVYA